ncbi:MAG: 4-hydroxy-tetrahydrodipicolinate synthase [Planctomycetota bacterium]
MLNGVYTALVTPFLEDGIDWSAFEALIDEQISEGIHGLVPCGTTGESATLSVSEHDEIVDFVIRIANGRVPVLAGAGSNSTSEAVERTCHALEAGADGVLHIMPYYNRPTQDGLLAHVRAVAAVGLPVVVYNIPSRTGVSIALETYRRMADIPNVVATKEASGNLEMAESLLADGKLKVLAGDDQLTFPLLCLGGHGVISVTSNIAPRLMVDLYDYVLDGQVPRAREQHFRLLPLMKSLFVETNPAPIKAALACQGKIEEILRLPLVSVREETRARLRAAMELALGDGGSE